MGRSTFTTTQSVSGTTSIEDMSRSTGSRYYVDSVTGRNASGYGFVPDMPFASLAFAVTQVTANKGDIIYCMPGHAETISAAAGIACSTAGFTIVGLGNGSNLPTFSFSNTASSWTISAANVTIQNIRVTPTVDEVVSMFSVSAAYCTLDNVEHFETASSQTIQFLLTTNAADYLTIKNCYHYQINAAGSAQKWIQLVGVDGARIIDNTFLIVANASTSSHLISGSTAVVYCEISRNNILFIGGTITIIVNLVTGSTGIIADNRAGSGTAVATAAAFTGDACFMFNNLWADTAAASGLLAPVVDTDT